MKFQFYFFFTALSLISGAQSSPAYKNASLPVEMRVNDLIGRMTQEEKFWQLFMIPGDLDKADSMMYYNGIFGFQVSAAAKGDAAGQLLNYSTRENATSLAKKINSIQRYFIEKSRLGIPIIAFDEALHGLVRDGATAFPQAIGLAASWDTALMSDVAKAIAVETRIRGIRQILSPVVNIASDVRWGRTEETYGEDPFLCSEMGVAFVSAFEKMGIVTTPKHFIANVGDGGKDSYPIHWNERILVENYLAPFKACFERGGSRSVMTAYNSLDGIACSANSWLLQKKLKGDMGFTGFVISDANAVGGELVLHHTAKDYAESGEHAINNGLDVIFQTDYNHYKLFNPPFLDGRIDSNRLNEAVRRVLKVKFDLGLFENPYVPENDARLTMPDMHKNIVRQAAVKSIVLLKNSRNILPIQRDIRSIAVIGTDAMEARLGGYSGPGNGKINILDGLKEKAGSSTKIMFAPGPGRNSEEYKPVPGKYLRYNSENGLQGEYFDNISVEGPPVVQRIDKDINFRWTLFSPDPKIRVDYYSVRWKGKLISPKTGKFKIGLEGDDGYRLYIGGQLLVDNWKKQSYRTTVVDYYFEKNKSYDIRIDFFEPDGNATIKLIWNMEGVDQWKKKIEEAVAITRQAAIAVVVTGITEGEFQDRAMLTLPGHQEEMIERIAATGKPVIVLLTGGSAVTMNRWVDKIQGLVEIWYPGEEGGRAVADVLFGDYNPAGRLPISFPVNEAQLPWVYYHTSTGRGDDYNNLSGKPLFPFGYGLSYTTFKYSDMMFSKNKIVPNDSCIVSCVVTNTGTKGGDEVVQLYIHDELASVARPLMELKGFQRIHLKSGESRKISFNISPLLLSMLNLKLERVVEPGDFRIMIGASSTDIRLKGDLTVISN